MPATEFDQFSHLGNLLPVFLSSDSENKLENTNFRGSQYGHITRKSEETPEELYCFSAGSKSLSRFDHRILRLCYLNSTHFFIEIVFTHNLRVSLHCAFKLSLVRSVVW